VHGFESRTRCQKIILCTERAISLGKQLPERLGQWPNVRQKTPSKALIKRRGPNGQENLEKQQQTATNLGAWKRSGPKLEIRQSQNYEPRLLLEAWQRFQSEGMGNGSNLTVQQLCEKFLTRQIAERRSVQTLADDRWRLNAFSRAVGHARAAGVKRSDILRYLEGIPPGTNRRSHYKTLRKLWRWAFDLGHVEHDPMNRLKPLDSWGVNNEVLSAELFQRFLRVTQGLEAPREGVSVSGKYRRLLPYFVLGGLQGLRTCEMARERADYPVIEWRDFKWEKNLIVVRDEVAKQTRARDKLRYVPLEAASVKLLRSLAGDGPVIQIARRAFQSLRRELCREMRVRWPENCLRNSYATYAQTFRSSGDVARAMGDAEGTVKRFYVQTLEPGVGKNWFNLPADPANS
jgi:hypothetical protein